MGIIIRWYAIKNEADCRFDFFLIRISFLIFLYMKRALVPVNAPVAEPRGLRRPIVVVLYLADLPEDPVHQLIQFEVRPLGFDVPVESHHVPDQFYLLVLAVLLPDPSGVHCELPIAVRIILGFHPAARLVVADIERIALEGESVDPHRPGVAVGELEDVIGLDAGYGLLVEGVEAVVVGCDAFDPDVMLFVIVVAGAVDDFVMPFPVPVGVVELDELVERVNLVVLDVGVQLLHSLVDAGSHVGLYGLVGGVVALVVMEVIGEPAVLVLG